MDTSEVQPLNVLVIDDDPAALRLAAKIVSTAGHHVSQAGNGRLALDMILQDPPDLVLCDWDMPEMDGVELCRQIRGRCLAQYVYFLLLTGKSSTDELVAGLAAGADDFVTKPINRAVLLARLEAGARVVRKDRILRGIAQCDPLTGIMNRRAFHERFTMEWERACRHHRPLSCVMADLDLFKRINDEHGHAAGDVVIQTVAKLLEDQCRASDVVCRYGGEEFCVLLTETNEAGAACWAEHVRRAVSETTIPAGDLSLRVTVSMGVAERLTDITSVEKLVDLADQALAVAKQSGRDRVVCYGSLHELMPNLSDGKESAGPLDNISVRDVMSTAILCPNQDDTVRQVADFFLQLRVNSAPVVDDAGMLVGVVSEDDLMKQTSLGEGWEGRIRDVMRRNVVCYEENAPVRQVYQFLSRVSIRRVVVVDRGRPTGVISRGTLLRWFRNWVATRREAVDHHSGWSDNERACRKAGIVKTAEATARRATQLRRRVANEEDSDFVPCVVGEATRLQSLVNDLLALCRASL